MAEKPNIRPLNKLYVKLGKQMTAEDLGSMKALLKGEQIKREDEEKVKAAVDLFYYLEDRGYISEDNLELLKQVFQTMERLPLDQTVDKYLKDRGKREKQEPQGRNTMDMPKLTPRTSSEETIRETLYKDPKIIQDPIHGTVQLDPVYMEIIDKPEFQRLREIKQLGTVSFVYPGAVHTRFEHSIGTCYLALKMVRHLKGRYQEDVEITRREELCIGLAALCHDLGHGPFSHLFENYFLPRYKPSGYEDWSHELGSIKIFDKMVDKYNLKEVFRRNYGYKLNGHDFHMIKEMIYGPLVINDKQEYKKADTYKAILWDRQFLYQIVSNKANQIDVDKWDYFARDSHHLGVSSNFLHDRFIEFARVLQDPRKDERMRYICYRDKEAHSAYEMFHTRYRLYRMAYFHPVTVAVDLMISDALMRAADHLTLTKSNRETFNMRDILHDMDAYLTLDDTILNVIRRSHLNPELDEARDILERIQKRELYKLVRRIKLKKDADIDENLVKVEDIVEYDESLLTEDICFKIVSLDYGMGDKNPVDNVLFYDKRNHIAKIMSPDEVSYLLPKTFQERHLFIYVKDSTKMSMASECVDKWAANQPWIPKREQATSPDSKTTEPQCLPHKSRKRAYDGGEGSSKTKRSSQYDQE